LAETGDTSSIDVHRLPAIAQNLVSEQGANTVLLVGKEFALIFDAETFDFPTTDCAVSFVGAAPTRLGIGIAIRRQTGQRDGGSGSNALPEQAEQESP
jgi:hypothetical protein